MVLRQPVGQFQVGCSRGSVHHCKVPFLWCYSPLPRVTPLGASPSVGCTPHTSLVTPVIIGVIQWAVALDNAYPCETSGISCLQPESATALSTNTEFYHSTMYILGHYSRDFIHFTWIQAQSVPDFQHKSWVFGIYEVARNTSASEHLESDYSHKSGHNYLSHPI